MSASETSLHRTLSVRTIARNDGHKDGHLNLIATRHGWTRTLSISPEDVATLDYATLEAALELNTLKLRQQNLRIYVEEPPNSGTFCKIRYWKGDSSLQTILVQRFFNQRMSDGVVTTLDVKDGHDRSDTISVKSGISGSRILPGSLSRPGETKAWLKRRGLGRSDSSVRDGLPHDDDDDDIPPARPQASRTQALFYFLGLTSQPPAPPPKTDEQLAQEARSEEEHLRKRGWMPPVLKRITSKKSTGSGRNRIVASNPFFSASERNLLRRKGSRTQGNGNPADEEEVLIDGEELRNVNEEEINDPKGKAPQKDNRWFKLFGSGNEGNGKEPNPFMGSKEKGKGNRRGKVEIVGKPTDAFERGPTPVEE